MSLEIKENLNFLEYRANKDFLSSSDVKILLENPFKFKIDFEPARRESLALGTAIHALILEKEKFNDNFIIMPHLDLRKKADKELKATLEVEAISKKKTLLSYEIYNKAIEVVSNFEKTKIASLFKGGLAEVSFFGEIEGVKCKCRTDYFLKDKGLILDLKTTSIDNGASADNFIRAVANFKYFIQAAFYLQLTGAKEFYFIIVETSAPYMSGVYKLDVNSLEFGLKEIKRAFEIYKNLDKYKEPIFLDFENNYQIVQEVTLPNYVYYKKGASF